MTRPEHELRTARGIVVWSAVGLIVWAGVILTLSL
jgi:hypothetical protein